MQNLNFARGFLLLFTPIVPLTLGLSTSPSLAATLAISEATLQINNLSHDPLEVVLLTETTTNIIASNSSVSADNSVTAYFLTDPSSAYNSSSSTTNGDGSWYFGMAESIAAVIGYNFQLNNGETFSFNFDADLNLETSIDNPQFEVANANGDLSFVLYDTTDRDDWIPLDYFTLSGEITTLSKNDYLDYDNSDNINLNLNATIVDSDFRGRQENTKASIQGSFSRSFDTLTSLTLVAAKTNQAEVQADNSVTVPEPSSILGLLLCTIGMGYRITSKAFSSRLAGRLQR